MVDEDVLRVSTTFQPDGGVRLAVQGYLDDTGGKTLARTIRDDPPAHGASVDIDLEKVVLFNCSGARRLLSAVDDLQRGGGHVHLSGVHGPLQRVLDLAG
jgi:anti-anti-sigma regulatory factor